MTTTPGPRTEAGKRLLDLLHKADAGPLADTVAADWEGSIFLIEAEARADVDGLVARLMLSRHLPVHPVTGKPCACAVHEDARALLAGDKAEHTHEWIDARNEVVTSGEVCLCGAFRAGNPSAGDKAEAPLDG